MSKDLHADLFAQGLFLLTSWVGILLIQRFQALELLVGHAVARLLVFVRVWRPRPRGSVRRRPRLGLDFASMIGWLLDTTRLLMVSSTR